MTELGSCHICEQWGHTNCAYHSPEIMTNKPHIIGLVGYAQTGKDTAARHLAKYGYQRLAFADALRDALYALNPIVSYNLGLVRLADVVDTNGWERAKRWPEIRRLLQQIGSDIICRFDGRQALIDMVMAQPTAGNRYVITDVRFPDECRAIKDAGGVLWRIDRPDIGPINDHASEHALADFVCDATVLNDSCHEMFELRLDHLYHKLTGDWPSEWGAKPV